MTNISEAAERIYALRDSLGETQEQFAKRVGVKAPTISFWEKGDEDHAPGPGAYSSLGNLAAKFRSIEDAFWFWEQAGLDEKAMLVVAGQILKAEPSEMVAALLRKLPSKTRWFPVSEKSAGFAASPGDVVVLDESATAGPGDSLEPFWNRVVLAEFAPRSERREGQAAIDWPEGPFMGRLRCQVFQLDRLLWFAELGPFSDSRTAYRHGDNATLIGDWKYKGPQSEPRQAREEAESKAPANVRLWKGCTIKGREVFRYNLSDQGK